MLCLGMCLRCFRLVLLVGRFARIHSIIGFSVMLRGVCCVDACAATGAVTAVVVVVALLLFY